MKALLLADDEATVLRELLERVGDRSGLIERLDRGGDRALVQVGMEGGQVLGAFANCPVEVVVVEWDEKNVYDFVGRVDVAVVTDIHKAWVAYEENSDEDDETDYAPLLDEFRDIIGASDRRLSVAPGQG